MKIEKYLRPATWSFILGLTVAFWSFVAYNLISFFNENKF